MYVHKYSKDMQHRKEVDMLSPAVSHAVAGYYYAYIDEWVGLDYDDIHNSPEDFLLYTISVDY